MKFIAKSNELQFSTNVLQDVPWEIYELLVDSVQHARFRHSYDNGTLEMMSPSFEHESTHRFISRLIESFCLQWDIPIICAGSMTQRRESVHKGVEPDACYFIQQESAVRQKRLRDQPLPTPDLAIEVDHTSSSIPRLPLYAKLGIPEVWRYDGKQLVFLLRSRTGVYKPISHSKALPPITPDDILKFLKQRGEKGETAGVRGFLNHMIQKIGHPGVPPSPKFKRGKLE